MAQTLASQAGVCVRTSAVFPAPGKSYQVQQLLFSVAVAMDAMRGNRVRNIHLPSPYPYWMNASDSFFLSTEPAGAREWRAGYENRVGCGATMLPSSLVLLKHTHALTPHRYDVARWVGSHSCGPSSAAPSFGIAVLCPLSLSHDSPMPRSAKNPESLEGGEQQTEWIPGSRPTDHKTTASLPVGGLTDRDNPAGWMGSMTSC